MNEQQQFIEKIDMRLKNMIWYARKRVSTEEEILCKFRWFLGYIKAMWDVGAIDVGRYWYYRNCAQGIVNKYAYREEDEA